MKCRDGPIRGRLRACVNCAMPRHSLPGCSRHTELGGSWVDTVVIKKRRLGDNLSSIQLLVSPKLEHRINLPCLSVSALATALPLCLCLCVSLCVSVSPPPPLSLSLCVAQWYVMVHFIDNSTSRFVDLLCLCLSLCLSLSSPPPLSLSLYASACINLNI